MPGTILRTVYVSTHLKLSPHSEIGTITILILLGEEVEAQRTGEMSPRLCVKNVVEPGFLCI